MSRYSLTEALKQACYQRLHLQSQLSPPVASVHKSRNEPAGRMTVEQHMQPRRRNDEIVSVPVRPWHSPRVRANGLYSASPPSLSLEPRGMHTKQNNCLVQQQNDFRALHSALSESSLADDSKTMGTELCVSDTISQDPSVSDNYLCERSARISYSKNCSNSIRQMNSKRRRSRHQRAGESGRHQGRQDRNGCNLLPGSGYGPRQNWPGMDGRYGGTHQMQGNAFCSSKAHYLRSIHLSGLFSNANCMAELRSAGQSSEMADPEFGCEDLKVRGQWQDALSNDESGTEATRTDDRSVELGTDQSALTLSRAELSSTAAAHMIVEPPKIGRGGVAMVSALTNGHLVQAMRYQMMQTNNAPGLLNAQTQHEQCQQELQKPEQLHLSRLGRQSGSPPPAASNCYSGTGNLPLVANRQSGNGSPPLSAIHNQADGGGSLPMAQAGKGSPPMAQVGRSSPPIAVTHLQTGRGSPPMAAANRQSGSGSPPMATANRQSGSGSPPLATANRQSGSGSPPMAAANHQSGSGSPPLATANRQSGSGSLPMAAPTGRQAPSHGGVRNPISHNSSKSSFSLNQSEFSSRESTTGREEMIPTSDDLVHLSVASCLEAASGSEAEASTAPGAETEGDDEADTTLHDEADRLAMPLPVTEDHQPRVRVKLHVSQKQQQQQQKQQVASVMETTTDAAAADSNAAGFMTGFFPVDVSDASRRGNDSGGASRYGRLRTPDYCKRSSFLSVLRHNIAHAHVSHRAKIKPPLAAGGHRSKAGN